MTGGRPGRHPRRALCPEALRGPVPSKPRRRLAGRQRIKPKDGWGGGVGACPEGFIEGLHRKERHPQNRRCNGRGGNVLFLRRTAFIPRRNAYLLDPAPFSLALHLASLRRRYVRLRGRRAYAPEGTSTPLTSRLPGRTSGRSPIGRTHRPRVRPPTATLDRCRSALLSAILFRLGADGGS